MRPHQVGQRTLAPTGNPTFQVSSKTRPHPKKLVALGGGGGGLYPPRAPRLANSLGEKSKKDHERKRESLDVHHNAGPRAAEAVLLCGVGHACCKTCLRASLQRTWRWEIYVGRRWPHDRATCSHARVAQSCAVSPVAAERLDAILCWGCSFHRLAYLPMRHWFKRQKCWA